MEMWCPHDTGRDSWDWVGPPIWERASFNSPEWGGGSSPVKTGASPDCIIVVVEWLYYSERMTSANFFSLIFVCKMCVFVSRPMKIVTFLMKNGDTAKRVVDFPLERYTFRNKIMEIVKNFDEKSYNNNGKPWKSSRILRLNPFFFFFFHFSFFFHHFSPFFIFFIFFIFSFFQFFFIFFQFFFVFFFLFLSLSFTFFHFLSLSIILYHFISFSFIFHQFLSFSCMFFHFPSFSFIFFHFLSFSFIFLSFFFHVLGCSKSDF